MSERISSMMLGEGIVSFEGAGSQDAPVASLQFRCSSVVIDVESEYMEHYTALDGVRSLDQRVLLREEVSMRCSVEPDSLEMLMPAVSSEERKTVRMLSVGDAVRTIRFPKK